MYIQINSVFICVLLFLPAYFLFNNLCTPSFPVPTGPFFVKKVSLLTAPNQPWANETGGASVDFGRRVVRGGGEDDLCRGRR